MKRVFLSLLAALAFGSALSAADPEKEVLAALDAWKQGTMRKDMALLSKVLHKDVVFTHSSGTVQTKDDNLKAVAAPRIKTSAIEFSNTKVRIFGDTAVVRTHADLTSASDGKQPGTSHLIILHVFVKTPEGWQMIDRQATKMGN
jgi:ketosteroid isomerase-like protein